MSTLVNWNGQQYLVPAYNDTGYAQGNGNLSQYLVAISTGSLQQVGGLFQLTADADFGPNFGLVSSYFKSRSANIASAGVLRLANTDAIKWRNSNNSADVTLAMNVTGTAAVTYTIPDIATSSFVMSEGNQTINGTKTFGSATLFPDGLISAPSISFSSETGLGLYRAAAGHLAFTYGGAITFQIRGVNQDIRASYDIVAGSHTNLGNTTDYFGRLFMGLGSAATPAITTATDSSSGFYFGGTNDVYLSLGGTGRYTFLAAQMRIPDGTEAAPAFVFGSDTNTGVYTFGSDSFAISCGGTRRWSVDPTNGTVSTLRTYSAFGTAALPSYAFVGNENTGMYRGGADDIGFSTGASQRFEIASTYCWTLTNQHFFQGGSASVPSIAFQSDTNTGIYLSAADRVAFSCGGTLKGQFRTEGLEMGASTQVWAADGLVSAPAYSFASDPNSGLFNEGGDFIKVVTGGALRISVRNGDVRFAVDAVSAGAAAANLGTATDYWNDVSYKTLTDRGCLPFCDEGVELSDGTIVSDTEAIKSIQKHPTKKTVHGLPMLDYKTFPKKAYKPADADGVLIPRDENDEPIGAADGVEMTMMFGVMLGAIKELTERIEKIEKK